MGVPRRLDIPVSQAATTAVVSLDVLLHVAVLIAGLSLTWLTLDSYLRVTSSLEPRTLPPRRRQRSWSGGGADQDADEEAAESLISPREQTVSSPRLFRNALGLQLAEVRLSRNVPLCLSLARRSRPLAPKRPTLVSLGAWRFATWSPHPPLPPVAARTFAASSSKCSKPRLSPNARQHGVTTNGEGVGARRVELDALVCIAFGSYANV